MWRRFKDTGTEREYLIISLHHPEGDAPRLANAVPLTEVPSATDCSPRLPTPFATTGGTPLTLVRVASPKGRRLANTALTGLQSPAEGNPPSVLIHRNAVAPLCVFLLLFYKVCINDIFTTALSVCGGTAIWRCACL